MPWSDFNIAQELHLYWEIVPLIICYIKLNVQDDDYIQKQEVIPPPHLLHWSGCLPHPLPVFVAESN